MAQSQEKMQGQIHGPVATPLPSSPSDDFLTPAQWDILVALFDGVLPAFAAASDVDARKDQKNGAGTVVTVADDDFNQAVDLAAHSTAHPRTREAIVAFLRLRPAQSPEFREACLRVLSLSPDRHQFAKVLGLMGTRVGSLLFTGYWSPVDQQPAQVREAIIKSWSSSRFLTLRVLAKNIVTLAQNADALTSPLLRELSGYSDVPKGWKPVQGYDYKFIQVPRAATVNDTEPHVITTDVVIVGSGCGGAVSAKNLAEAGHDVLVVDKGYHFPPAHLPMPQDAAMNYLFDNGGVYMTKGGTCGIVCGGAWGGGGTVNWSVTLKLQDYVRREWAADGKLPFFTSSQFDESVDRVGGFMGAGTSGIRHNHRNRVLLEGSRKLGWRAAEAPQNTAGKEHYCGQCHLGCGSGEKRGSAVSWLPAAGDAGAQFMEGLRVDRVLFAEDGKTAVGVEGLWTSRDASGGVHTPLSERTQRRVVVKAKRVIMSAGSLWSPLLLMKSDIQNQHLGQNLHIHPCNFVTATYDEVTHPWEGGIITSYSPEFENIDEKGHGVKLEPMCMVPYSVLAMQPWYSGLDAKVQTLNYGHLASFIALTRDRDTGRIVIDEHTGAPSIEYTASDYDAEHTLEGVQALAKLCYVTGARDIRAHTGDIEPFVPARDSTSTSTHPNSKEDKSPDPEFTDPAFADWLRRLRKAGNKPPGATWTSAHQMGTCRMGASEAEGVVDGRGRVWGTEGLYVADASVFPSASGVNPMLTTMTLADWISRGVSEELRG